MLPLEVTRFIKHSLQSAFLSHNLLNRIANIAFEAYITASRQPSQYMKRICVYACCSRHPPVVRQAGLQDDFESFETPAVAQAQADEVGKSIEDIVMRRYCKNDVFDEAAGALVQRRKRMYAACQAERKHIIAVQNLPRLLIYLLIQSQDLWNDRVAQWDALWPWTLASPSLIQVWSLLRPVKPYSA